MVRGEWVGGRKRRQESGARLEEKEEKEEEEEERGKKHQAKININRQKTKQIIHTIFTFNIYKWLCLL